MVPDPINRGDPTPGGKYSPEKEDCGNNHSNHQTQRYTHDDIRSPCSYGLKSIYDNRETETDEGPGQENQRKTEEDSQGC
jgi:hypothetical protein